VLRFREPVWNDPAQAAAAQRRLAALPQFASLTGPFDVNGVTLTPAQLTVLHATLGEPGALSPEPRDGVPAATWTAYRAEATGTSAYGVAGVAPSGYDVGHASGADLLRVIPVAIIVPVRVTASSAGNSLPSARMAVISIRRSRTCATTVARYRPKPARCSSRSDGGTITSAISRPIISSDRYPKIRSALHYPTPAGGLG
jgi:hypothetical protein